MNYFARTPFRSRFERLRARLVIDRIGQTPDRRTHVLPDAAPQALHRVVDRAALSGLTTTLVTMLSIHSLRSRKRMSHENGLCARGSLRILDQLDLPEHAFFTPGKQLRCRLRHSSVSFEDDASLVVRSASLKFADSNYEAPLDIEMNTGEISLFSTAWQFTQFLVSTIRGRGKHFAHYFERNPHGLDASHLGVRRNPKSFADLRYYSEAVFRFEALDGTVYACRYRLVPGEPVVESGIPSDADLDCIWEQDPLPDEDLGPNYLKREYRARVLRGPVRYQLQIQLYPLSDITHDEAFNASAAWDEREVPWRPLAEVCIDETMRRPEGNLVRFSIGHQPRGLGLFRARSPFDYHSLNHLRAASSWAKRARVASYALHGMPDPISEVRGEPSA